MGPTPADVQPAPAFPGPAYIAAGAAPAGAFPGQAPASGTGAPGYAAPYGAPPNANGQPASWAGQAGGYTPDGSGTPYGTPQPPGRSRGSAIALVLAIAVALAAGFAVYWFGFHGRSSQPPAPAPTSATASRSVPVPASMTATTTPSRSSATTKAPASTTRAPSSARSSTVPGATHALVCLNYSLSLLNDPSVLDLTISYATSASDLASTIGSSSDLFEAVDPAGLPTAMQESLATMTGLMQGWQATAEAGDLAGAQSAYRSDRAAYAAAFAQYQAAGGQFCAS